MSKTVKRHSPYEAMMRKFSEAHKEECRTVVVDVPKEERPEQTFITGSKYKGTWNVLGMSGPAVYTFPNGVIYEGEFEDGERHGKGELRYPTGEIINGKFRHGRIVERTLTFADGLEYSNTDWMYCKCPDRRKRNVTLQIPALQYNYKATERLYIREGEFSSTMRILYTIEYEKGVMPAGNSNLTADQPTREIPPGYYHTGDGFFDPISKMVYKLDDPTCILRCPSDAEHKWIIENCRKAPNEPIGPRPDIYEDWLEPETEPEPAPLPAAPSRATTWMFQSKRSLMSNYSDDSDDSCRDVAKWVRRIRKSSIENIAIFEKFKSRILCSQSMSQLNVRNSATPENRPWMQSTVGKSTSEKSFRSRVSQSSMGGKSTTSERHIKSCIPVEKLAKSENEDGQCIPQSSFLDLKLKYIKSGHSIISRKSVVRNSMTSDNLVTFRLGTKKLNSSSSS